MRPVSLLLLCALVGLAQQYRAFWADAFHDGYKNPGQVDRMIEDLVTARCNGIFIEVRHRGGSYHANSLEPPVEDATWLRGFDALQYTIEKAHARGIEVHAWYPVTPLWPFTRPPVDPRHVWHAHGPHAEGDAMWMTVSSAGAKSTSVDPGHPDVLKYLVDVMIEPIKHYDLDGIHLDYIRYPEDADYGWNPAAVERFNRLYNRVGSPVAREARWSEFRRRQVTELVRQTYLRAHALKPSIKVTAALISWGNGPLNDAGFLGTDAYARVFQDWRGWMQEGILDLGMPMNYFREAANASFFDRWLEFEKDRQYNRGILVGPAVYLNSIADSLRQLQRALAPSAAGNRAMGVSFYSYASTNLLNAAGNPIEPNADFYRRVGEQFGAPARIPELAWLARPVKGHVMGTLTVDGGARGLHDGVTVWIEPEDGSEGARTSTDGTGFFGAVDLAPGLYRVRLERGGVELLRATPKEVKAGEVTAFELFLKGEDFAPATPRLAGLSKTQASPGEVVAITGSGFGLAAAEAAGLPLPVELSGVQVLVNGRAAPLLRVDPGRIEMQMPFAEVAEWRISVRQAGLESAPLALRYVETNPEIVVVNRRDDGFLEVGATGLGMIHPPQQGFTLVTARVEAFVTPQGGTERPAEVMYAGLTRYAGVYQVNVRLPEGVTRGTVRVRAGSSVSAAATF